MDSESKSFPTIQLIPAANGLALPGKSKLLGDPDVPPDFEWPVMQEDGEEYALTFLCQICLEDLLAHRPEGCPLPISLPERGMLYFFYDAEGQPTSRSPRDVAAILYSPTDGRSFSPMQLEDEEGNSLSLPSIPLTFSWTSAEVSGEDAADHKLFGIPHLPYTELSSALEHKQLLLQLSSLSTAEGSLRFPGNGRLLYLLPSQITDFETALQQFSIYVVYTS